MSTNAIPVKEKIAPVQSTTYTTTPPKSASVLKRVEKAVSGTPKKAQTDHVPVGLPITPIKSSYTVPHDTRVIHTPTREPIRPSGDITHTISAPLLDNHLTAALGAEDAKNIRDVNRSMVDGSILNPFAIQSQEAAMRNEANRRATTGAQIHAAGFAGSPIGAGYGNVAEAQLASDRFGNMLGIETARNEMKLKGAEQAAQWADNANKFDLTKNAMEKANEKADLDLANQRYDNANQDISTYWATSPLALEKIRNGDSAAIAQALQNPQIRAALTQLYGDGLTDEQMASALVNRANEYYQSTDYTAQQERYINGILDRMPEFSTEGLEGDALAAAQQNRKEVLSDLMNLFNGSLLGVEFYKNEDGLMQVRRVGDDPSEGEAKYQHGVSDPINSEAAVNIRTNESATPTDIRSVASDTAARVRSGEVTPQQVAGLFKDSDVTETFKDELTKQLRESGTVIDSVTYDGGWGINTLTELDSIKGGVVVVNGKPLYLSNISVNRDWFNSHVYHFIDLTTGNTYKVDAEHFKGKRTSLQNGLENAGLKWM